jgi:fused signal recognition particle receptor
MTQAPEHDPVSADRDRHPVGVDAHEFGADLVAAVDLDAVATQLAQLPGAVLLAELEGIVAAIDNLDPVRRRRRAGVWGRLLGRDLVAQAQPDPVPTRIRLGLAAAQEHADELQRRTRALDQLSSRIQQQIAHLDTRLAQERAALMNAGGDDARIAARFRRLDHLAAIATSWRASVAQIALVRAHAEQLLARHAQVRDVLASLWQAQTSAQAATAALDHDGIARLHASLRELAASQPASTLPVAPPGAHPDRPAKEPSS